MTRAEKVDLIERTILENPDWTRKQVAEHLGMNPATVRNLLNDPDGSKQRERRKRYQGVCGACGAPTDGSSGRAKAPARCAACSAAEQHHDRYWTQATIIAAFQAFNRKMGRPPTTPDVMGSPSIRARVSAARVAEIREAKESGVRMPHPWVVQREFGSWNQALRVAGFEPNAVGRPAHRGLSDPSAKLKEYSFVVRLFPWRSARKMAA